MNKRLLILFLVSSFLFGCEEYDNEKHIIIYDENRNFNNFYEKTQEFPYKISKEKRNIFLNGTLRIEKNNSKTTIKGLIGTPDLITSVYTENNILISETWIYLIKVTEKNELNKKRDAYLSVYFDKAGRLFWLEPFGLPDVNSIGEADYSRVKRIVMFGSDRNINTGAW